MNEVWVVSVGENGEGSSIYGIFSTKPKALEFATSIKPHFNAWEREHDSKDKWWSGCDYLMVQRYSVE